MKYIVCGLAALALLGCSRTTSSGAGPAEDPPKRGEIAPPPAWISARTSGAHWLAYSSYCWSAPGTQMCADFAAPSCADDRIPKIELRPGELVRFHLGFDPTEVSIAFGKSKPKQLSSSRRPGSRVIHEGVMLLFTHGRGGDASYVACLQFTGAT